MRNKTSLFPAFVAKSANVECTHLAGVGGPRGFKCLRGL